MKRLLFSCICVLLAAVAVAQNEAPTTNWPYLYPEFKDGEIQRTRGKAVKSMLNIHLNLGTLHYVENGKIKEANTLGIDSITIGEDLFRNVGGKMLKVLAETEGGYVVEEARGNFTAVVRNDGAYGTTGLNSTTTKTFLYNENVVNAYNGYLLTDVYADLLAMKDQGEKLPVNRNMYIVIGIEQIPASKKNVADLDGLDKKAFKAYLKSEDIQWDDPQDLVKVIEYVKSR